MIWDPITRRHFLQGVSAALALPLLESLTPKRVYAQVAAQQKNFIGIAAWNGLFRMFGPTSILMPRTSPVNGRLNGYQSVTTNLPHRVHYKRLTEAAAENGGVVSDLVGSAYTPYLDRMLMLQGLDYVALGWFHHTAQFGNFADVAGDSGLPEMATIDQVMAHSTGFYKNTNLLGRSIAYTASWQQQQYSPSYTFNDPTSIATKNSAGIQRKSAYYNPATLWDAFIAPTIPQSNSLRGTLVDKVLSDYQSARSNPRLGVEDRYVLDRHIAQLHETERRVKSVNSCIAVMRPDSNLADRSIILRTMNDVIVSIISCGLCHSFVGHAMSLVNSDLDFWHARSHEAYENDTDTIANQTSYDFLVDQNRAVLDDMCLDLMRKLDQAGLMSNSLIVWIQEHNKRGHECWNVPIIAFGDAGGRLNTGYYVDYRNFETQLTTPQVNDTEISRFGVPINQAYATFLQAMDVPPSEFNALNKATNSTLFAANSGYGPSTLNISSWHHYSASKWGSYNMNQYLPVTAAA